MEFLSKKFDEALSYAAEAHRFQKRKSARAPGVAHAENGTPYIGHLISVAGIVIDAGGDEDEAIAALLHDVVEDQGGLSRLSDIGTLFGPRVAEIVENCSDSTSDDPKAKLPADRRKAAYIAHLRTLSDISTYIVSASDKLHNARCTARDLSVASNPNDVWSKFSLNRVDTLKYYTNLADTYDAGPKDPRRDPIVAELRKAIVEMTAAR